jgi:hypothetical protein
MMDDRHSVFACREVDKLFSQLPEYTNPIEYMHPYINIHI